MLPWVIIVNMTFPRFALCHILLSQIVSDPGNENTQTYQEELVILI